MKNSEIITTLGQLRNLVNKMRRIEEFAFDTETNTLEVMGENSQFKLVGISISWGDYDNYYIPVGHVFEEEQIELRTVVRYLRPIFEREDVRIIGHNLKFDMHVLNRVGIEIKTLDLFDTMIASWLCDENTPNGLEFNTETILNIKQTSFKEVTDTVTKEEKKEYGFRPNARPTFDLVRVEHGGLYALADSYFTWELYLKFMDKLEEEEMEKIYNVVYKSLIRNVFKMESRGVTIDEEKLAMMEVEMQEDIEQLMYDMYELAGVEFNPASSQQLAELLFGEDNLEVYKNPNQHILDVTFNFPVESRTPKGAPQSSNRILSHLSKREYQVERKREGIELVNKLLEFKKLNKLKSAFVDGIREQMYEDGKVHPSFNIIGTTSGRFSCSKPNVQQIPNADDGDKYQIRELFIGNMNEETGTRNKIISCDYSNLEMRVMTHFSKDELLMKMFNHGDDAHGSTAVNMFELDCHPNEAKDKYPMLRNVGKTINFLLAYGGGASALYETLKEQGMNLDEPQYLKEFKCKKGIEVAQKYIDKYFDTYSGVADFLKNQKRFARRNEYVYTVLGRKRRLVNINGNDFGTASYEERLALNQPIQGTAGDIMNSALNRIEGDMYLVEELKCKTIMQVHDELIFECPEENVDEAVKIILHYMENSFGDDKPLNLPFTADYGVGNSYQEAK